MMSHRRFWFWFWSDARLLACFGIVLRRHQAFKHTSTCSVTSAAVSHQLHGGHPHSGNPQLPRATYNETHQQAQWHSASGSRAVTRGLLWPVATGSCVMLVQVQGFVCHSCAKVFAKAPGMPKHQGLFGADAPSTRLQTSQ